MKPQFARFTVQLPRDKPYVVTYDDPLFPLTREPLQAPAVFAPQRQHYPTAPAPVAETIPLMREALSAIDLRIRSLADQKNLLESRLADAVALQSPIRRLPREVLAAVFAVGVSQLDEEDPLFLARLSLVSRDWRDTALGSPDLWANIRIDHHGGLRRAQRRVILSKAVPLDIDINFVPRERGPNQSPDAILVTVVRALDLLRPETHRWRRFALRVQYASPAHAALARCFEHAPRLTHFAVHVQMSHLDAVCSSPVNVLRPRRDSELILFGGHTPMLRSVELGGAPLPSSPGALGGALMRGLRTLRLVGNCGTAPPSVSDLLSTMRNCPALEELSLRNMEDVHCVSYHCLYDVEYDFGTTSRSTQMLAPTKSSSVLLPMPRLRRLSLVFCGPERASGLLAQLSMPVLERAEFIHMDNITSALKSLKHSAATLKTLRIENSLFDELKLMRLLRRLPKISDLQLVECDDVSPNLLRVSSLALSR